MKKKESVGVRILLGFLSFLLCVCLFVTTVAAIVILDVRVLTGKQQLQNLISDVLFSPVAVRPVSAARGLGSAGAAVRPVAAKLAAHRLAEATREESTDKQILLWVYDTLKSQFGDQLPVSYAQVEDFFERSTLKDFLADKISSVVNDMYNGTDTTTVTEAELRQQMIANKALVASCFSVELTDEAIDYAVEWVMNSGILDYINARNLEIILNGGSLEDIVGGESGGNVSGDASGGNSNSVGGGSGTSSSAGSTESIGAILGSIAKGDVSNLGVSSMFALVRGLTSVTVLIGVISAAVILIGLLFLANLRRVHVALIDSGVTILLAGGLMLLPVVLSVLFNAMLSGPLGILIQKLLMMTATVSGGAAGLGLVLIIAGIVVACVSKKKAQAAEA